MFFKKPKRGQDDGLRTFPGTNIDLRQIRGIKWLKKLFLPALVRTYNAGLGSSSSCWGVINQNTAIFANFVQFHHAFPTVGRQHIASCITGRRPAELQYILSRTAVIAQNCIIVQFHHAFSSFARQACPAALPISTGFDARARLLLLSHRTARADVQTGLNLLLVQFHHAFIICMRALLSSRQV
jgi:hypothetical protein